MMRQRAFDIDAAPLITPRFFASLHVYVAAAYASMPRLATPFR